MAECEAAVVLVVEREELLVEAILVDPPGAGEGWVAAVSIHQVAQGGTEDPVAATRAAATAAEEKVEEAWVAASKAAGGMVNLAAAVAGEGVA